MFHQTDTRSPQSLLRLLRVLVLHLLLTRSCRGQYQLIGPPQFIVSGVGDDIILPCHLKPEMDVTAETLEWTRSDLHPRFVHVRRYSQDLVNVQNPSYRGRTSLFISELKHGNISLKLSRVQLSDQGTYGCDIPLQYKWSSVKLVVALETASSPVITLSGVDRNRGGVVLNCDSNSWYPEPEVSWLDSEGHVLSAGPTGTVRGPDGLYTVSSRVTVEKRDNNNVTCRVQQKNINQIRETHFYILDDLFELQSSSYALTLSLAVTSAVCTLIIVSFVFFCWRQNRNNTERSCRDETDGGEKKKKSCFKRHKSEDKFVTEEEREREPLRTDGAVEMRVLNEKKEKKKFFRMGKGQKKNKHQLQDEQQGREEQRREEQQLQEEQQRREEAENRVKQLQEELKTKEKQVKDKQDELQQFNKERTRNEEELKNLKEQLEKKNKEVKTLRDELAQYSKLSWDFNKGEYYKKKRKAKKDVKTLKEKLETCEKELDTKNKEFNDKLAEVQQLQDERERIKTNLQTEREDLNLLVSAACSPHMCPSVSDTEAQGAP